MNNEYYNHFNRQTPPHVGNAPKINGDNKKKAPDFFIDDSLFLNIGIRGDFHMSFPDSSTDRDKIFHGVIVEATADHIVVHNDKHNEWYLLPLLYLNYAASKEQPNLKN